MTAPDRITTLIMNGAHPQLHSAVTTILEQASAEEKDDRFGQAWLSQISEAKSNFIAALACRSSKPQALLYGTIDDHLLRIEGLAVSQPNAANHAILAQLLDELRTATDESGIHISRVDTIEYWAKPDQPWHQALAADQGWVETRALHQMRCQLPVATEPLATRSFDPANDLELLLGLNNRAFAGHPDQGNLSLVELSGRLSEPWNRPDGIRIYEHEGKPAGFCWTKIHNSHQADPLGEIYVIGIDPEFHGQGLGVPMTASGLHWLADQGLQTGMLYVEANNAPALATYYKLGFEIWRTDRAWIGQFRTRGLAGGPTPA